MGAFGGDRARGATLVVGVGDGTTVDGPGRGAVVFLVKAQAVKATARWTHFHLALGPSSPTTEKRRRGFSSYILIGALKV